MSVSSHLGIKLTDYDARIRTFIPDYDEMLDVAAGAVPARTRTIVDLGVGTGALSARCLARATRARVVGIDVDPGIVTLAARRLRHHRATFTTGSFLRTPLPPCDAMVASFALHHVRTQAAKRALYRRICAALGRDGVFVVVDCQPASDPAVRRAQRDAWLAHLCRWHSARQASALLAAWSHEDVYVPLEREMELMRLTGFRVEVLWRRGAFAVLRARGERRNQ
jgi:ubiquinone/menaquinone biosynthesis C-methylase UbiE